MLHVQRRIAFHSTLFTANSASAIFTNFLRHRLKETYLYKSEAFLSQMFMFEHSSMSDGDQVHHVTTQSWMLWLINSSPPSLPNTLKTKWNQNKNWQHWALLVFGEDTRFLESIFVCFFSPELYYFRGDRAKPLIKAIRRFFQFPLLLHER